jgi:hypothetical protein
MAVVGPPTTVTASHGEPTTRDLAFATSPLPLVGFSVIEARDLDEAIALVAKTPCAVAKGAIEVRPLVEP